MKYLRSVYNHSGLLRGHRAVPVCRAVDLLSNHAQKLYIKLLCIVHLLTKQAGVHLSEKSTKQTTKNPPPELFSYRSVSIDVFPDAAIDRWQIDFCPPAIIGPAAVHIQSCSRKH